VNFVNVDNRVVPAMHPTSGAVLLPACDEKPRKFQRRERDIWWTMFAVRWTLLVRRASAHVTRLRTSYYYNTS